MERADNLKGTHRDEPTAPLGAGDYTRSTAATHLLQGTAVNLPQRPSTKPKRLLGHLTRSIGVEFVFFCGPPFVVQRWQEFVASGARIQEVGGM